MCFVFVRCDAHEGIRCTRERERGEKSAKHSNDSFTNGE